MSLCVSNKHSGEGGLPIWHEVRYLSYLIMTQLIRFSGNSNGLFLLKRKNYNSSNIIGVDIVMQIGGKVEAIDLIEGLSTTSVIDENKKTN